MNPHSIKRNLTHRWWWDTDDFASNQFGHPYQGSLYFNAGRANGRVEELDLLLKGGREYSRTDFSSSASYDEMMRYAGGDGVHIQYGKGIGHDTKEVFDTFTIDL